MFCYTLVPLKLIRSFKSSFISANPFSFHVESIFEVHLCTFRVRANRIRVLLLLLFTEYTIPSTNQLLNTSFLKIFHFEIMLVNVTLNSVKRKQKGFYNNSTKVRT